MATKRPSRPKTSAGSKSGSTAGLRATILEAFATHWSEEGHPPRSVARFCKGLGITEAVFFKHFPSLHAVEKAFWRGWISKIISAVEGGEDWEEFASRERYLAFLFALTQSATERRSLLLERFHNVSPLSHPGALEGMRSEFLEFAHRLIDHGRETGEIADRRGLTSLYPGILYVHLRWVIDQWLKDESEGFERTDAFIEKTVTLAFDLFRSQALDSAADLLRFLLPGNPWNGCSGKGK
jgi:AcrR family transcriptional regulator